MVEGGAPSKPEPLVANLLPSMLGDDSCDMEAPAAALAPIAEVEEDSNGAKSAPPPPPIVGVCLPLTRRLGPWAFIWVIVVAFTICFCVALQFFVSSNTSVFSHVWLSLS